MRYAGKKVCPWLSAMVVPTRPAGHAAATIMEREALPGCAEFARQRGLLEVASRPRDLKVPIDGIIQDWQHWPAGNNTWGSHQFGPAWMPKQLHKMHHHTLILVWAAVPSAIEKGPYT